MGLQIRCTHNQAARIFIILVAADLCLTAAYLFTHLGYPDLRMGPLRLALDVDAEISIPTWFSSMQYFAAGVLLFAAAGNNQHGHHISSAYLRLGGLLFLLLSIDESAALHEKMTTIAKNAGQEWMLINGHAAWLFLYAVLFVSAAMLGAKQLKSLWQHCRAEMRIGLAGALLLAAGAVGFEISSYSFMGDEAGAARTYMWLVATEELFEMLGMSIVLYATLRLATKLSARDDAQP